MKKLNYFVVLICTTAGLISCNNELIDSTNEESVIKTKSLEVASSDTIVQTYNFLYKGVNYEALIQMVNDSIISIKDQAVEKIFADLNKLPNLVTYQHRDGTIEYFDNRDALMSVWANIVEKEKSEVFGRKAPRRVVDNPACDAVSQGYYANLFLCDDDNYSGKVRHIFLSTAHRDTVVNHLKPNYDMNDKTTSFCAYSFGGQTLFELWEDDHLDGNCFSFTCFEQDIHVLNITDAYLRYPLHGAVIAPDLKNRPVIGTKRSSWNDRITSVRITRF